MPPRPGVTVMDPQADLKAALGITPSLKKSETKVSSVVMLEGAAALKAAAGSIRLQSGRTFPEKGAPCVVEAYELSVFRDLLNTAGDTIANLVELLERLDGAE